MQSRKDKINSKDITERFLFSLFDSSVMSQVAERVYTLRSLIDKRCGMMFSWKYRQIVKGGDGGFGIVSRIRKKFKF